MNDRNKELLSAHLDGALSEEEALELARGWDDSRLEVTARRYRVVGEYLRLNAGMGSRDSGVCLVERVRKDVEREPRLDTAESAAAQTQAGRVVPLRRWSRSLTALAMAAGVAAVAIGGLRMLAVPDEPQAVPVAEAPDTAVKSPANSIAPALGRLATSDWSYADGRSVEQPKVRKRLNLYLANHSEVTGGGALPPYVRVVGHRAVNDAQ